MAKNKKSLLEFKNEELKRYADKFDIAQRSTADLSKLEEYLIEDKYDNWYSPLWDERYGKLDTTKAFAFKP